MISAFSGASELAKAVGLAKLVGVGTSSAEKVPDDPTPDAKRGTSGRSLDMSQWLVTKVVGAGTDSKLPEVFNKVAETGSGLTESLSHRLPEGLLAKIAEAGGDLSQRLLEGGLLSADALGFLASLYSAPAVDLNAMEAVPSYGWRPVVIGDELPEGAVPVSGHRYVGRNSRGECGCLLVSDGIVKGIKCKDLGRAGKGEVLVLSSHARSKPVCWRPIRRGDSLPEGAVFAGRPGADADVYVARDQGVCGKLKVASSVVQGFLCDSRGLLEAGEVLVIAGLAPPAEGPLSRATDVGWIAETRNSNGASDVTDHFSAILGDIRSGDHWLARRWDRTYLIVPGLFCNKYPMYMQGTKSHLRDLGLDCRIARINTGTSVANNASAVCQQVSDIFGQTGKPVVLIGHSKGGCDAVAAVSRFARELRGKVLGVVCLQSPLGGTPLADDLLGGYLSDYTLRAIKHILGGDAESLGDLTYHRRMQELRNFPFPSEEFPCVTFSSGTRSMASPLAPLTKHLRSRYEGVVTDGMVASLDADLPSSLRVWYAEDWDHGRCAFPTATGSREHLLVNEAAIALLVQKCAR